MPHIIESATASTPQGPVSAPTPVVAPGLRQSLLELSRVALAVATARAPVPTLTRELGRWRAEEGPGAVFVTLTDHGLLRGCVGCLDPGRRLHEAVVAATISAALDDTRFVPVAAAELPALRIDISVLGPVSPLPDPREFRAGTDGIIVERGGRRGLLLPEVATKALWGGPEMLAAACRKAGLPDDAWRDPRTSLHTFRTIRFGGPALTNHQVPHGTQEVA